MRAGGLRSAVLRLRGCFYGCSCNLQLCSLQPAGSASACNLPGVCAPLCHRPGLPQPVRALAARRAGERPQLAGKDGPGGGARRGERDSGGGSGTNLRPCAARPPRLSRSAATHGCPPAYALLPLQLEEIFNFFRGPNRDYPKAANFELKYAKLQLVTSAGPYTDDKGRARTALAMPLLEDAEVERLAGEVLARPRKATRLAVEAAWQESQQRSKAAFEQQLAALMADLPGRAAELAAAGLTPDAVQRIQAAVADLEVPASAASGNLLATTVATAAVCTVGGLSVWVAGALFGPSAGASALRALATTPWLREQLLAVEGALTPEAAQQRSAQLSNIQLLAGAQQELEQHAPPGVAEQFSDAVEAAPDSFLSLVQRHEVLAVNVAGVALAAALYSDSGGAIAAAVRLLPSSNSESIGRLGRGQLAWLRQAMLPGADMAPEAAALRQHGRVPEAAAAALPEPEREAALGWQEEVVQAVCSRAGQLVACGRATPQQAQRAVQAAAGLVLPVSFTSYVHRKGGKRTNPGTAAMVVMVSMGLVNSYKQVGLLFGKPASNSHSTAAKSIMAGKSLAWLPGQLAAHGGSIRQGRVGRSGAGAAGASAGGGGGKKKKKKAGGGKK